MPVNFILFHTMNKGKVEQIGTPFEIYSNPQSLFVADFIGQANIVKLEVSAIDDDLLLWSYGRRPSRLRSRQERLMLSLRRCSLPFS